MSTQTIDVTPSWEGVLPYLITIIENGSFEGHRLAREELHRMARLADLAVRMKKEGK
jgi:hypothetical protein